MSRQSCHIVSIMSAKKESRVSREELARLLSLCCFDQPLCWAALHIIILLTRTKTKDKYDYGKDYWY